MIVTYDIGLPGVTVTANFTDNTAVWESARPGDPPQQQYTFAEVLEITADMPPDAFPFGAMAADMRAAIHNREENNV